MAGPRLGCCATATRSSRHRACPSVTWRPSCPPGRRQRALFANRGANGIDGLVSTASGGGWRHPEPGPTWCSATSPSPTTSAASWSRAGARKPARDRHRQRRRRDLQLPPPSRWCWTRTNSRRCSGRPWGCAPRTLRGLYGLEPVAPRGPGPIPGSPARRVPGFIVVRTDRAENLGAAPATQRPRRRVARAPPCARSRAR